MSKAGDISVSLILDGADDFKVRVKRSADSLDSLSNAGGRFNKSAAEGQERTRRWTSELRDYAVILGLARSAIENVSDLFLALPRAILQQNAMLERNTALIEGMAVASMSMGDAQKYASSQIMDLFGISSSSPYAIESIIDAFTKLKVGGIQEVEKSLESLINTAAKFGSTSEQLKRGSIAIQQMMGKGVISMEELRQQLGEAIPDIMNIMSRALQMPMDKMVKMIATGTVKAGPAIEAMFAEMYWTSAGYAERMSNTWDGMVNQFKNQMTLLAKVVGDAGFFSEMKQILGEMADMSSSDGFADAAYNFGEGLAAAARAGYELVKVIGENLKLIAALAAVWAGSSMLKGMGEMAQGAINKWDSMTEGHRTAMAQIYSDRIDANNRLNRAHEDAIARADALSLRDHDMTRKRYWNLVDEHTRAVETRARTELADLNRRERELNGFAGRMKSAGGFMLDMVGGWTTVLMAGLMGLIFAYDELWGKQKRAAENINESMGGSATVASVKDANDQLKRLTDERSKITNRLEKGLFDQEFDISKAGPGMGMAGAIYGVTKSSLTRDLDKLNGEIKTLEGNLERAAVTLSNSARSFAVSSLEGQVSQELREITAAYSGEARKIQDEASRIGGEAGEQYMKSHLTALRKGSAEKIRAVYEEQIKYHREQLNAIQDQVKRTGVMDDDQKDRIRKHAEAIRAANEKSAEAQEKINAGGYESLNRSEKAVSASSERLHTILRQNEGLEAQNRYLKDGGDITTEQSKMLFELASKYKELPESQKAQMLNAAKIQDGLRTEQELIKRNIELYEQAVVRIGNMEAQVAKKLGRARAGSENPLMSWNAGWLEELERIDVVRKEMMASGKHTAKDLQRLDNIAEMQREINGLTILNGLKKESIAIGDSIMTAEQRMAAQHQRTVANIAELREQVRESTAIRDEDRKAIEAQIDAYERLVDTQYKLESDPLAKWSKSVDELAESVDNVLVDTMTGFFDAVAEAVTSSEASFSDMIDSMYKQLAKFFVKLAMMQAVQAMFQQWGVTTDASGGAGGANVSAGFAQAVGNSISNMASGMGSKAPAYRPDRVSQMQPSVNIINQTGVGATGEQSAPRFDGEKYVTDIVMKAASRPGKFRNSMKGI